MNDTTIAVSIFSAAMIITLIIGIISGRGHTKSLSEWSVSSRGLGTLFVLFLMAGESYTSFSFLGTAGWSYSYGVPILYLIAYLSSGLVIAYLVGPLLWQYAAQHNLVSISDIVEYRFQSRYLGITVAIAATIFIIPNIQLQLQGMGAVINAMSYGQVDLKVAAIIGFIVAEIFILASGIRGSAWVGTFKDAAAVISIAILAVYIPLHYFNGLGQLVDRLVSEKPELLTFPGGKGGIFGSGWFISTVILNGVTINIFPTTVTGFLSAKSPATLRQNSMILPWYQLLLFVPMMVGLSALFVMPTLKNSDLALFSVVTDSLPAWVVAIIGTAGALSAIVPMSVFMVSIGTMWGRTVLGGGYRKPEMQGRSRQRLFAQIICVLAGFIGLAGSLWYPHALVNLSVLSYEGMAQLVTVVLLPLLMRVVSKFGAICGMVIGIGVVALFHQYGNDPFHGINVGLIGLIMNITVVIAISLIQRSRNSAIA